MNGLGRKEKKSKQKQSIFTKETWGVIILLTATILSVCLVTGDQVFSLPGKYVQVFLLGCFGYFAFAVMAFCLLIGGELLIGKRIKMRFKNKLLLTLSFLLVAVFTQVVSMGKSDNISEYLKLSYTLAEGGFATTSAGGFFTALLAFPIQSLLTVVGGAVVLAVLAFVCVLAFIRSIGRGENKQPKETFRSTSINTEKEDQSAVVQSELNNDQTTVERVQTVAPKKTQSLFINNEKDFGFKSKREIAKGNDSTIKVDFTEGKIGLAYSNGSYSEKYSEEMKKKLEYIKTPPKIDLDKPFGNSYYSTTSVSKEIPKTDSVSTREQAQIKDLPLYEHEVPPMEDSAEKSANDFTNKYAQLSETSVFDNVKNEPEQIYSPIDEQPKVEPEVSNFNSGIRRAVFESAPIEETPEEEPIQVVEEIPVVEEEIIDDSQEQVIEQDSQNEFLAEEEPPVSNVTSRSRRIMGFGSALEEPKKTEEETKEFKVENLSRRRGLDFASKEPVVEQIVEEPKKEKVVPPINRKYYRPPLDLLENHSANYDEASENHEERKAIIKQTLEDFHINAETQGHVQGPTITRYEIKMPAGITVKKVLAYDDDLKMRLASREGVRIEAPIPGKNLVGIEVANNKRVTVGIRELIEKSAEKPSKPGSLIFAIGKDIVGNVITDNLAKGPHYLVAGATGSGKSVCLNVMIISLIMRYSPEELRLILVDPKSVGFRIYEHIPHLMIDEIITDPKRALAALAWAQVEMEKRYKTFAECGELVSDIDMYNEKIASDTVAKMPRIVVVIDELADLMETCKKEMETRIRALAQKSRAAGIHLVLATQRPSVDIITGTIKANLPSRIALKVMGFADSNTIINQGGAEKLLGNGDMLYRNSGMPECERYQGAWISDREITGVVNYIKEKNQAYFDDELSEYLDKATQAPQPEKTSSDGGDEQEEGEVNEFFLKALWHAVNSGTVSISMLQRRFQIGYARAGRLVDEMEQMGFVSANEGAKARRVLLTREEFEERFGAAPEN